MAKLFYDLLRVIFNILVIVGFIVLLINIFRG